MPETEAERERRKRFYRVLQSHYARQRSARHDLHYHCSNGGDILEPFLTWMAEEVRASHQLMQQHCGRINHLRYTVKKPKFASAAKPAVPRPQRQMTRFVTRRQEDFEHTLQMASAHVRAEKEEAESLRIRLAHARQAKGMMDISQAALLSDAEQTRLAWKGARQRLKVAERRHQRDMDDVARRRHWAVKTARKMGKHVEDAEMMLERVRKRLKAERASFAIDISSTQSESIAVCEELSTAKARVAQLESAIVATRDQNAKLQLALSDVEQHYELLHTIFERQCSDVEEQAIKIASLEHERAATTMAFISISREGEVVETLRTQIEELRRFYSTFEQENKQLVTDLETVRSRCSDLENARQEINAKLEDAKRAYELCSKELRRAQEVAWSAEGLAAAEKVRGDDATSAVKVLERANKHVVEERTAQKDKMSALIEELEQLQAENQRLQAAACQSGSAQTEGNADNTRTEHMGANVDPGVKKSGARHRKWTQEEDDLLLGLLSRGEKLTQKIMSDHFGDRSYAACLARKRALLSRSSGVAQLADKRKRPLPNDPEHNTSGSASPLLDPPQSTPGERLPEAGSPLETPSDLPYPKRARLTLPSPPSSTTASAPPSPILPEATVSFDYHRMRGDEESLGTVSLERSRTGNGRSTSAPINHQKIDGDGERIFSLDSADVPLYVPLQP